MTDFLSFRKRSFGTKYVDLDAVLPQPLYLVLHQGQKRGNDQGDPMSIGYSWNLKTKAVAVQHETRLSRFM